MSEKAPIRVMLVEDERDIQTVVKLSLESKGDFEVKVANSGEEALKMATKVKPQIILLDFMMPGMDGEETLTRLREIPEVAEVPIVFMTAKIQSSQQDSFLDMGAQGVIPKPFDPIKLPDQVQEIYQASQEAREEEDGEEEEELSFEEEFRRLKRRYFASLPSKISEARELWEKVNHEKTLEPLDELFRLVHSMAGTSGTYGLSSFSQYLSSLEMILKPLTQKPELIDSKKLKIERLLALLPTLLDLPEEKDEETEGFSSSQEGTPSREILLALSDKEEASKLVQGLQAFAYGARVIASQEKFKSTLESDFSGAVVMDIDFLPPLEMTRAQGLSHPHRPLIILSSQGDFKSRLQAAQMGSAAFVSRPFSLEKLVDKIDHLTGRDRDHPHRALVIDDNLNVASQYASILRKEGMEVQVLDQPEKVVEMLFDFEPEIAILDLYMPISGLDIASVIHQHDAFSFLPILFISTETNLDCQFSAVFQAGDDFLTKPVNPNHLILSVKCRIERYRRLSSLVSRDSLTGLLNHSHFKSELEREIKRSHRSSEDFVLAMIDIDHFKNINDTYGHFVGDQVIKNLAHILQNRLRKSDTIARYGGEEFAVILPQTSLEKARELMESFREDFSKIEQRSGEKSFLATFSCGLARGGGKSDVESLIKAADKALYQAKEKGRNRVFG